ncbi:hypothetical protein PPL_06186 [Heterostelium album PN500]|uniref:Uncharacterized protein n=1 Tax=Heterostelium pallidum (strain ATCC 26659 / Pp 5 / PN500) TaxID=670386 RepID=D3BCG1_HETP5|nr:hypothetical protein PPL_06186 [Heterostelium album PN500]EFA80951.1 hypothetical protein PPL_06186 [Heterostelium album PN500]|eukprot:XP_020433069.1 hypothetical protein PPL_06186 [Heterostelium album PN500]
MSKFINIFLVALVVVFGMIALSSANEDIIVNGVNENSYSVDIREHYSQDVFPGQHERLDVNAHASYEQRPYYYSNRWW